MPIDVSSGSSTIPSPEIGGVSPGDKRVSIPEGLNQTELNDPNSIEVTIADQTTPIVVLYGPPSCGKTMTLVRMARFLRDEGYTVVPERTFRPTQDTHYQELCEDFNRKINSTTAANSTTNISFMLVKVLKDGKPVCMLLEAPGEYYFNPQNPLSPYPAYVHEIINSNNRKVWAIMVEPDWDDQETRANYVARIQDLKSQMSYKDKVVFVYNKIDKTPFVKGAGVVNTTEAIKHVNNLYPGIFSKFKNENPITKLFQPYKCEFVPFTTGNYSEKIGGGFTYTEAPKIYAQKLWNVMLKRING